MVFGGSQAVLAASKLGLSIYIGGHPIDDLTAQIFAQMGLSFGIGLGAKIILNKFPSTIEQFKAVKEVCQNSLKDIRNAHFCASASFVIAGGQFALSLAKMGINLYSKKSPLDAIIVQAFGYMGLSYGLGLGIKIALGKFEKVWQT